jgi:hypothetical protein
MKARKPTIQDYGIVAEHDMACAVYAEKSAVLQLNTGVFQPSWEAQENGWRLVHARNRFQRLVLRLLFGVV